MLKAFYFALHFAVILLGILIAIHHDMTLGILITASGVFMFWAMLPQYEDRGRHE